MRPTRGQIDDLLGEIRRRAERKERILLTTLTKKMAEDLTDYLREQGVAVRYMHSDINVMERMEIIRDLRLGVFDVLVGINLLREGLDLPEVSLVAILDADKEGYLRSERSLIQTMGRAARNLNGQVIMYADKVTDSMDRAIRESERRRTKQLEFNRQHNITPASVIKAVREVLEATRVAEAGAPYEAGKKGKLTKKEIRKQLAGLEKQMKEAARKLEFERAAQLRDLIIELRLELRGREKSLASAIGSGELE